LGDIIINIININANTRLKFQMTHISWLKSNGQKWW